MTFQEQGLGNIIIPEWMGIIANAETPPSETALFHQAIQKALSAPTLLNAFEQQQCKALKMTTAEFSTLVSNTSQRWEQVVKETGFSLNG